MKREPSESRSCAGHFGNGFTIHLRSMLADPANGVSPYVLALFRRRSKPLWRFTCAEACGESVFRRFAAQAAGGTPTRRGEPGTVRGAVPYEGELAQNVSAAFRRTGWMERLPAGPRSKLAPKMLLEMRGWVELQLDQALVELRQRLVERRSLYGSLSRLREVLGLPGLGMESRSRPPSRTPKKAGAAARSGASGPAGLPRRG